MAGLVPAIHVLLAVKTWHDEQASPEPRRASAVMPCGIFAFLHASSDLSCHFAHLLSVPLWSLRWPRLTRPQRKTASPRNITGQPGVEPALLNGLREAIARGDTGWLDIDPQDSAPSITAGNLVLYHVG